MNDKTDEPKDELPEDLDVTKYVGPYRFPSPAKRKVSAYSIWVISLLTVLVGFNSENTALVGAGIFAFIIGLIFFVTAWPLKTTDLQALLLAAKAAPFSVGHASAQISFHGWFSKPAWRVVVFSSDDPPSERGLVEINAVTSELVSTYFDEEKS